MRRALLPLACLLLLAACAQPAAAATKKERQRICAKRGFTEASSAVARVFEVNRGGDHSLYGCMRSNGRSQLLSCWFSCECSVGDQIAPDVELHAGRASSRSPSTWRAALCPTRPAAARRRRCATCAGGGPTPCRTRSARSWRAAARSHTPTGASCSSRRKVATVVDALGGTELALARTRSTGCATASRSRRRFSSGRLRGRGRAAAPSARPRSAGARSAGARSRARSGARRRPRASCRRARGSSGA